MSVVGVWDVWYSAVEIGLQGNVQWFFWSHRKLLSKQASPASYLYMCFCLCPYAVATVWYLCAAMLADENSQNTLVV